MLFGLPHKGRLEEGFDADLVLIEKDARSEITEASILSRCGWSPFVGRPAAPKPRAVYLDGRLAARDGSVPLCTVCTPDLLHSYRRGDRHGRQWGWIRIAG